ncbi:MAG: hypothetical protein QXV01_01520 [Candidatus Bathyarchaeia archaeon]
MTRGRKKSPLPPKSLLNDKDLLDLDSPRFSKKLRVYYKVFEQCNYNISATANFFKAHYPQFSVDRKTLRRYLDSFYYAQKLSKRFNGILSEEEVTRFLYILARRKLQRSIREPNEGMANE